MPTGRSVTAPSSTSCLLGTTGPASQEQQKFPVLEAVGPHSSFLRQDRGGSRTAMGDSAYGGTHGTGTSLDHSPAITPRQGNAAMARVTDPRRWRAYWLSPSPQTSLPFPPPQGRGTARAAQRRGADP